MPHRRSRSHTQEHATTIDKTQEARFRRAAIDPVEQPLTADATVPVTVEFAGDDG